MKKIGIIISLFIMLFVGNFSQAEFLGNSSEGLNRNISWLLFVSIILIVIILLIYFLNKKKKKIIVVQYSPPEGIDSAKAGLLLYRRSNSISIISLIYKWIGDGLISIDTVENQVQNRGDKKISYILHKKKEISEIAPSYELLFWKSLFDSGETTKIDENMDLDLDPSLNAMEEYGYNSGWFAKKTFIDEPGFVVMGIIVALMILIWIIPNSPENKETMSLILIILYVIFNLFPKIGVIVGINIPKFKKLKITQKGENLVSHLLGFREFLITCDADVLRKFLKQDPLYFDKIISYAVVFGVESLLMEKFHDLIDDFGLKLYVYQIKNPFYNILDDSEEYQSRMEKWNPGSVIRGDGGGRGFGHSSLGKGGSSGK